MQTITVTALFPALYIHLVPLMILLVEQNERITRCKMGRNRRREFVSHVQLKGVTTMLSREEYVLNMVLRSSSAVTTDVPTLSRMEEYAGATEGRIVLRNVAMKNAPTLLFKEEYAISMAQNVHLRRYAATKDVPIMLRKEEYVEGTVPR